MAQPVWWEYSKKHFYRERKRYIRLQRDRQLIPPEERLSSGGIKTDWIPTMTAKSDMLYSRIIYEFSCWFSGLRQSKFVVRRFTFSAIAGIKKSLFRFSQIVILLLSNFIGYVSPKRMPGQCDQLSELLAIRDFNFGRRLSLRQSSSLNWSRQGQAVSRSAELKRRLRHIAFVNCSWHE